MEVASLSGITHQERVWEYPLVVAAEPLLYFHI